MICKSNISHHFYVQFNASQNTCAILLEFTDTFNHHCFYEIFVFVHAFLTDTMVGLGIKGENQRLSWDDWRREGTCMVLKHSS